MIYTKRHLYKRNSLPLVLQRYNKSLKRARKTPKTFNRILTSQIKCKDHRNPCTLQSASSYNGRSAKVS